MRRTFLKAKIHRATVTDADLEYEGSISIGAQLLETTGILPYEKVEVYNVTGGERFATYVIVGEEGRICLNGAAAWKARVGDRVIIAAYCELEESEMSEFQPTVALMGDNNRIKTVTHGQLRI